MNQVILIGRLGKDPEHKNLQVGKSVCTFSLATSKKYNNVENTQWHNIVTWGKTADNCAKHLKKGSHVALTGEISYRSYEDSQGNKKYITEITSYDVEFLGRPQSNIANSMPNVDDDPFN